MRGRRLLLVTCCWATVESSREQRHVARARRQVATERVCVQTGNRGQRRFLMMTGKDIFLFAPTTLSTPSSPSSLSSLSTDTLSLVSFGIRAPKSGPHFASDPKLPSFRGLDPSQPSISTTCARDYFETRLGTAQYCKGGGHIYIQRDLPALRSLLRSQYRRCRSSSSHQKYGYLALALASRTETHRQSCPILSTKNG